MSEQPTSSTVMTLEHRSGARKVLQAVRSRGIWLLHWPLNGICRVKVTRAGVVKMTPQKSFEHWKLSEDSVQYIKEINAAV
jgi:hypothetical protein